MNPLKAVDRICFTIYFDAVDAAFQNFTRVFASPRYIHVDRGWTPSSNQIIFKTLFLGHAHYLESVFWKPRNCDVAVHLSNWSDGNISGITYLSRAYRPLTVYTDLRFGTQDPYSNTTFEIFKDFAKIRHLQAVLAEGGWHFFNTGEVLPFENPSYYKHRKVRDRFNYTIAIEYLLKMGIDVESDEFWQTDVEPYYLVSSPLAVEQNLAPYTRSTSRVQ